MMLLAAIRLLRPPNDKHAGELPGQPVGGDGRVARPLAEDSEARFPLVHADGIRFDDQIGGAHGQDTVLKTDDQVRSDMSAPNVEVAVILGLTNLDRDRPRSVKFGETGDEGVAGDLAVRPGRRECRCRAECP